MQLITSTHEPLLSFECQVIGLSTFISSLHGPNVGRVAGNPFVLALLRVNIRIIVSVPGRFLIYLIDFYATLIIILMLVLVIIVLVVVHLMSSLWRVLVIFLLRVLMPRCFLL